MGPAVRAAGLGADHAVARVDHVFDRVRLDRLEEARPAAPGLELGARIEEGLTTAHAHVRAVIVAIPVLTREGPLGAAAPGDFELLGGQAGTPLVVGLRKLVLVVVCHAGANARAWMVVPASTQRSAPRARARRMSARSATVAMTRGRRGQVPSSARIIQPSRGGSARSITTASKCSRTSRTRASGPSTAIATSTSSTSSSA